MTESPDLWIERGPSSPQYRRPDVERDRADRDPWYRGDEKLAPVGPTATAGQGDMLSSRTLHV